MNTVIEIFVGIDVSKDKLSVASEPPLIISGTYANTNEQVEALCDQVAALDVSLVVIEATGRMEALVAYALQDKGIPVAVINPRRARKFAQAAGTECKTDPIDAALLARFGRAMRPEPRPLPEVLTRMLQELVGRRRQLMAMRDAEKHRLGARLTPAVRNDIVEHVKELEKRLSTIDKDIDKRIKDSQEWSELSNVITSVPCVGPVVCSTLLAELPELGTLGKKQIAKLVGVAPFDRQSGKYTGSKAIFGGRARVRAVLYMAALSGSVRNPVIRSFYQKLINAGREAKVALTACMHKLLTILNAMARSRQMWSHQSVTTSNP
jgi:transposase